ncbi:MAG: transglutaminase-like domain-containing protein [Pirellulales bacterium]|nr:transglutaminase-like domain-containing protein [Pirellulales bacterium]
MAATVLSLSILPIATSARAQVSFSPLAGWDRQLFPSYLVATATIRLPEENEVDDDTAEYTVLGDRQGVLGVEIDAPADETSVTVTITGSEILEPSSLECTLDEEGATYRIYPPIRYKFGVLARNRQSIPVTVHYCVEIEDEEGEVESAEQTATLTLRSVNDCPYAVAGPDGDATDISFMFAAYVNEQHPFVDKVLREALDQGIVDSFAGYQAGDTAEVYRQVYALWNALSERDVRYSNITTEAATNGLVSSQHVRLIDESLNNGQANCVDGSVLLASLLRKIDIEPVLVYVPGHCYLAFYVDADKTKLVGLETTLIGGTADDNQRDLPDADDIVDDDTRGKNSWGTFCAAVAMGNADLAENQDKFNQDDVDYQLVSIAAARELGILPIAFAADRELEPGSSAAQEDEYEIEDDDE